MALTPEAMTTVRETADMIGLIRYLEAFRSADAWAKLDKHGDVLPLHAHAGDVAATMASLLHRTAFAGNLACCVERPLVETDWDRLLVLAFLHDLGKTNLGFWRRQFTGAARVGHTSQTAALFFAREICQKPAARRLHALIGAWGASHLFPAAMAHHGRPLEPYAEGGEAARTEIKTGQAFTDYWRIRDGYDPLDQLDQLLDHAERRFPGAYSPGPPLPQAPAFVSLFCGLLTLADWLGSDASLFPVGAPHGPERETLRAHAVASAVAGRGLGRTETPDCGFSATFGFPARGLQAAADDPKLGQIALLEAETGSGKTEAALWRWLALRKSGAVDGLYFALPTRSAAVQLHGRVQAMLGRVFGPAALEAVLAVPGYLRSGDAEGQALPDFQVLWPDDGGGDGRWAAERPKRFLAARVAIGTIDQVLMAGLQLRHAHLRAACLSRSLLVVDEVHASDTFMRAVLKQVLANHRALGGHALLLSATLTAQARAELLDVEGGASSIEASAVPYPMLSGATGRRVCAPLSSKPGKRVALEACPIMDDAASIAERAIGAARAGASVLVVRNSVAGAIAVARAVEAVPDLAFRVNGVGTLHHGRFGPGDRRLLDAAVEAAFGTKRSRQGRILCGTQTLEQSLDLDADLLITDLAPIDVLLQRIGRLHRHPRADRGPFADACAIVLVPAVRDLSHLLGGRPRHGLGPRRDGAGVYPNLLVLEATLRLIEANATIAIPTDNRRLVEGALHPDVIDVLAKEFGPQWANHAAFQSGVRYAERNQAGSWLLDLSQPFKSLLFRDQTEAVRTRLGLSDRIVDFDPPLAGPFGQPVRRLTVPGWMGADPDAPPVVEGHNERGARFAIGPHRFIYGRMGLERGPNDA